MEETDPNRLRDVEIKRLAQMAALAYKNSTDERLRMKTREDWFQKYTNAVLALNQLLKDSQHKDYERRLRIIEESSRTPRRMVLTRAMVEKRFGILRGRDRDKQSRRDSTRRSR